MKRWMSVVALGAFAVGASAYAAEPAARTFKTRVVKAAKPQSQEAQVPLAGTNVMVGIDPATGRLRPPTPEERAALKRGLEQMMSRSSAGLKTEQHSNGAKSVDLDGRFQSLTVARRNGDGTMTQACVTSADQAAAVMLGDDASSSTLETK